MDSNILSCGHLLYLDVDLDYIGLDYLEHNVLSCSSRHQTFELTPSLSWT